MSQEFQNFILEMMITGVGWSATQYASHTSCYTNHSLLLSSPSLFLTPLSLALSSYLYILLNNSSLSLPLTWEQLVAKSGTKNSLVFFTIAGQILPDQPFMGSLMYAFMYNGRILPHLPWQIAWLCVKEILCGGQNCIGNLLPSLFNCIQGAGS